MLNKRVFYPTLVLLLTALIFSLLFPSLFENYLSKLNDSLVSTFGWAFSGVTFLFFILSIVVFFSPVGKTKIGGENAVPLLSRWHWFAITLCTTIATGILFWGPAEPIFHLYQPAKGILVGSEEAEVFAISTLFLHWTVLPYSLYTITALVFAIGFYNQNNSFSIGTLLSPLLKENKTTANITDVIGLFGLCCGMAASLGAGILSISSGIDQLIGKPINGSNLIVAFFIISAFTYSATTGLLKGIKQLSIYNTFGFILIAILLLLLGPSSKIIELGVYGVKDFSFNFFSRALGIDSTLSNEWQNDWTIFYWANWMAWTPVTALFLGRLGVGYSVREFIIFNLILPSVFGGIWMMIFGGTSISFDGLNSGVIYQALQNEGTEAVIYAIFKFLPNPDWWLIVFLILVFISYVTAADSNISAMSGISQKGITKANQEAPIYLKLLWGIIIGGLSIVMISLSGVKGIKMLSVFGGFPALFLLFFVSVSMLKIILKVK